MTKRKRNYRKEYDDYHAKPEQKKRRAERNASRSKAKNAGKVKKGDGKEVHHTRPTISGALGSSTRVISRRANRRIGHPKP